MLKLFTTRPLVWLTALLLAVGPLAASAQTLTEDFETGVKAAYAAAPVALTSGSWNFSDAVVGTTAGSDRFNGAKSARLRNNGFIAMSFDKPNGAGTIIVNAGLYGTDAATATFTLEISTNGGTSYTAVPGVPTTLTSTLTPYTFTVNQSGAVRLRIGTTNTTTTTAPRVNIDDVSITDAAASTTPTVTATPATLTAFTAVQGTPSATQTITVGGSSLTAGVVVTAPAGYEVSLSAVTGFAGTVTVPQTSGTAASTPVYVRLTAAAVGTFGGNVTVASTGATAVNVAVTGTVTASAPISPTITSFTPATGAAGITVTITGTNLTAASAITVGGIAVTAFTVVSATSITFTLPATAVTGPIVVTTPNGTVTSSTSFTVTPAVAPPTITGFTPARAVAGVGFSLNINGTSLVAGTTISFNGNTYTGTALGSSGTGYSVVIPSSGVPAAGTYDITATNGGGTSTALSFLVVAPATTVAYEDFEQGTKTGYAAGAVTLRSGDWTFTEALSGNQFNDKANQVQSARVRGGGSITMNFDKPNGAGIVTISAALYGTTDTGVTFTAEVSTNGGVTYQPIVGTPATLTTTLTPYALTVNRSGNVRLRFSSTNATTASNPRINLDDLNITNYTGTATLAGQALPGLSVFPNPATDRITVELPSSAPATVALRDLTGRIVLAPASLAADKQLRLPVSLATGVYMLEVNQGGVTAVRRIEKN